MWVFFRPSANSCNVAAEMLVFMSQRSVHVMWNCVASEWRQTHTFCLMFVCKPLLWCGTFPLTLIKYCLYLSLPFSWKPLVCILYFWQWYDKNMQNRNKHCLQSPNLKPWRGGGGRWDDIIQMDAMEECE
jgi:hypothetical protein